MTLVRGSRLVAGAWPPTPSPELIVLRITGDPTDIPGCKTPAQVTPPSADCKAVLLFTHYAGQWRAHIASSRKRHSLIQGRTPGWSGIRHRHLPPRSDFNTQRNEWVITSGPVLRTTPTRAHGVPRTDYPLFALLSRATEVPFKRCTRVNNCWIIARPLRPRPLFLD